MTYYYPYIDYWTRFNNGRFEVDGIIISSKRALKKPTEIEDETNREDGTIEMLRMQLQGQKSSKLQSLHIFHAQKMG